MGTEIVIVGAGLAGAATAYHLRRSGVRDLIVLEKESAPGQHSTGRNAAMVRQCLDEPDLQQLNDEGATALRSGEFCEYRRTGSLLIGWGEEDVSARFPLASGRALWSPDDGVTDPAGLLATYLRGQKVLCNTTMLEWKPTHDGVAVRTTAGTISSRLLVNAAGAWAGVLGDLPLLPMNRHLFQTPPMPEVDPCWPIVWDVLNGLYFRPESGGLLLCACDEERRDPGDYRINHDVQTELGELLARLQPRLRQIAIKTAWTGQRTFSVDRRFVIGFDPRHAALFHVAGLGGHGVTTSYAVGRLAAELLLAGAPAESNPFDPARLLQGSPMPQRGNVT